MVEYYSNNKDVVSKETIVNAQEPVNTELQKVTVGAIGDPYDKFGGSTAIYKNTIVIGALGFKRLDNNDSDNSGAAYIFSYNSTGDFWDLEQMLTASNEIESADFGIAVAIDGDTVIIGAPWNSNQLYDHGNAYVSKTATASRYFDAKVHVTQCRVW